MGIQLQLPKRRHDAEHGRCSLAVALERVRAATGYDLLSASVRVGVGRGHLIDLVIRCGSFSAAGDPKADEACESLVELLLGDDTREVWVGSISSIPGPKPSLLRVVGKEDELFHPLATLTETVDGGIEGILAGLDERPYHRFCEHAAWTLLDVEPHTSETNWAAQDDLALCSTSLPEMLKCFLQGQPFHSARFSRNAEIFCYLKYCGLQGANETRLAELHKLEDAINRSLVPGGVGCVVGAGLGLRYGYVDLAMANLDHGVELTKQVFGANAVDGPGWLLFCDSAWSSEWVALRDGAEPPPGLRGAGVTAAADTGALSSPN